ncbi:band 7 protein AGAP004871 [Eurytemora carolleeae]|uniref:band 7 protein AGAP004871 n=1 Tax=Eurytemora carolleeae TaxID=1294199 RepID=UPI000C75E5DB|nr:band 7 protein AGAP004871 [Eurytemora carolleeae]|eukprot:XP_023341616.1 band 7 protein AGAP004871-like [Eurytemora affinis]
MPTSRNNSISGQINSFSGIHPPVPTGKQNAGVNGLKEHRENRDSTRNENSNLPLRKSENDLGKLKAFSALYTGQELREKEEENVTGLKKVLRFLTFGLSGDADGPGCCAFFLAIFSALIVIATLPLSLFFTVKVVKEYERAVIFRLGRLRMGGAKGPGIFFIIPCIDSFIKVDLRTVSFDVPPQEVRVSNPTMAMNNVEDFRHSTHLLAATTLRKDVRLPVQLQRAMAAEAEATREARAKVIQAEGEKTASTALRAASEIISINPAAMQLRYLQTLNSISGEKNSTIIFPIPIDFMANFGSKKLQ